MQLEEDSISVEPVAFETPLDRLLELTDRPHQLLASATTRNVQFAFKRALDVTIAVLLLLILLPVLLLIAASIRVWSRGPIFFRQERVGQYGRRFQMYKFRTMLPDADDAAHREYYRALVQGVAPRVDGQFKLGRDDPRITPIGRFLRRYSLDELPQLLNILRGDMSLVGPRPAIPYEIELYTEHEMGRLAAVPGLTGLWQVSGRNLLDFQDMVSLDLKYIEQWSLWLDILILLRTPLVVLAGRGAN